MLRLAAMVLMLLAGCADPSPPTMATSTTASSTSYDTHGPGMNVVKVDDVGEPNSDGFYELDWNEVPAANRSTELEQFMNDVRRLGTASLSSSHPYGNLTYDELWSGLHEALAARNAVHAPAESWMHDGPRVLFMGHVLMFRLQMVVS